MSEIIRTLRDVEQVLKNATEFFPQMSNEAKEDLLRRTLKVDEEVIRLWKQSLASHKFHEAL